MPLRGQIYAHLIYTLKAVTYTYYIIITAFNTLCLHVGAIDCDSRGNSTAAQAVFSVICLIVSFIAALLQSAFVSLKLIQYHTIRIQATLQI